MYNKGNRRKAGTAEWKAPAAASGPPDMLEARQQPLPPSSRGFAPSHYKFPRDTTSQRPPKLAKLKVDAHLRLARRVGRHDANWRQDAGPPSRPRLVVPTRYRKNKRELPCV